MDVSAIICVCVCVSIHHHHRHHHQQCRHHHHDHVRCQNAVLRSLPIKKIPPRQYKGAGACVSMTEKSASNTGTPRPPIIVAYRLYVDDCRIVPSTGTSITQSVIDLDLNIKINLLLMKVEHRRKAITRVHACLSVRPPFLGH
ncbi:hypothetical protein GE21DRAFT_1072102 [Neurospora crassa]|nr:hypothetical protein GE21DRAFT_1072102 [Neurospora crassa]